MNRSLELEEQQLTGFIHAQRGYSLTSLIQGMELTKSEWVQLKKQMSTKLTIDEISEIDTHLSWYG